MVSVSMWAAKLEQGMIVDYSSYELAERSGFDPAALVEEDYLVLETLAMLYGKEHIDHLIDGKWDL